MIRVSTIIPTYNNEATLAQAIDSALAQEFEGQEIIVVNDGSTDATQSVIESYGQQVLPLQQENEGPSAARNRAIEKAAGKYIAFLDGDDIWLPGRLSKTVAALERNPSAALVFSDYIRVDRSGALDQSSAVPAEMAHAPSMDEILTHWWPILPTTVTMLRSVWRRCGGFHTAAMSFEDVYLFLLARECGEFEFLAEPLAKFRLSSPEIGPDKWNPKVFLRLIRERYGSRARGLIAEIHGSYAGSFASKALRAMEQGKRKEAARCWLKVIRYDPLYPFKLTYVARLFRQRNARRIAQMIWPKRESE
jgi:glycosyltransferase involved in cell wall biosynthesis